MKAVIDKPAVMKRRQKLKRPVDNDDSICHHGCPQQHDSESLLIRKSMGPFVGNHLKLISAQIPHDLLLCRFAGKILMILLDQRNIDPHIQV